LEQNAAVLESHVAAGMIVPQLSQQTFEFRTLARVRSVT